MRIDALDSLMVILTVAAVTFMTRAAPFALQRRLMARRDWVAYLGKALPPAIMVLLVVYSLRSVSVAQYPYGLPEFIALFVVGALHVWKRNALISILSGTVVYMALVQRVFIAG